MCDCCGNRDPKAGPTITIIEPKKAEPKDEPKPEKK